MTSSEETKIKSIKGKDPMSPEEITSHEHTAVKRDPNDQKIAEGGKQVRIQKKPKKNKKKV